MALDELSQLANFFVAADERRNGRHAWHYATNVCAICGKEGS
jgi:ribosomal protein L37E